MVKVGKLAMNFRILRILALPAAVLAADRRDFSEKETDSP
jgi:hypothetical protein